MPYTPPHRLGAVLRAQHSCAFTHGKQLPLDSALITLHRKTNSRNPTSGIGSARSERTVLHKMNLATLVRLRELYTL